MWKSSPSNGRAQPQRGTSASQCLPFQGFDNRKGAYTQPKRGLHTTEKGAYTQPKRGLHTTEKGAYTQPKKGLHTTEKGLTHNRKGAYTLPKRGLHTTEKGLTHNRYVPHLDSNVWLASLSYIPATHRR